MHLLSYALSEERSVGRWELTAATGIEVDEYAVVLTHSYEQDQALLRELIPLDLQYLGILGPLHRTERLVNVVAPQLGMSCHECLRKINAPVGLDFGSDEPTVIALSIVSEMQATLLQRTGRLERSHPLSSPAVQPEEFTLLRPTLLKQEVDYKPNMLALL